MQRVGLEIDALGAVRQDAVFTGHGPSFDFFR
jgi:hypothetical protein